MQREKNEIEEIKKEKVKSPSLDQVDSCLVLAFARAVYIDTASNMIESTVAGFNATIFAYGQTSSGKHLRIILLDHLY